MGKEVAKTQPKRSLVAKMAAQYEVEPADFYETITQTMFKGANKSQLMTLLMVADQYNLSVVTKEIYAFPEKGGGIVPVVSIDGWLRLAHQHPQYDGEEIRWADKQIVPDGGKRCPEWCEVVVYRKDTSHPTIIREYLDEVYRKTGPWQSHTKRMLRHKAMIQAYRVAFGFSGIKDEDEAQRITVEEPALDRPAAASSNAEKARRVLTAPSTPAPPSPAPEAPPEVTSEVVEDVVQVDDNGEVIEDAAVEDEVGQVSDFGYSDEVEEVEAEVEEEFDAVEQIKQAFDAVEVTEEEEKKPILKATKKQLEALVAAKDKGGWTDAEVSGLIKARYGVEKARDLERTQAIDLIRHLLSQAALNTQEGLDL